MTQTINFTFESFEIEAKFSKDEESDENWELDNWRFVNIQTSFYRTMWERGYGYEEAGERVEAACYEALENNQE